MSEEYFAYEESENFNYPDSWNEQSVRKELLNFLQKNWEQRDSLFDDYSKRTKQQFLTIGKTGNLRTNNYIGTISFKGDVLHIFPKVFNVENKKPISKDLIKNLVQWLDYCNKFDSRFVSIKSDIDSDTNLKELFVTLFVKKLDLAIKHGLYFAYEEQQEDIKTIRGRFDLDNYLIKKVPNGKVDKLFCEYSSFEFDNLLNRIIKCVCSKIIKEGTRPTNEKKIREILNRFSDVKDTKCTVADCFKVRISKIQRGYLDVLSLCKIFLLNQEPNFAVNSKDTFCFLFPTDKLFEGFIGGYIKELISEKGGKVKLQTQEFRLVDDVVYDGKSYGGAFGLRPDILCSLDDKLFLLDTKYKQLNRFEKAKESYYSKKLGFIEGVDQNDLYQISIYALKHDLKNAYLLYPLNRLEDLEPDMPILKELIVTGQTINDIKFVNVFLARIPFVFEDDIEETKARMTKALNAVFNQNES